MRRPIWRTLWGLKPTAASMQNVLRPGAPWLSFVIKIFVYPIVAPGEPLHSSARYVFHVSVAWRAVT